jgi:hypothetical protein
MSKTSQQHRQRGYSRKLSVNTTTKERKSYTDRRVPERQEEHDYQKILLIGEDMVELQANAASIS